LEEAAHIETHKEVQEPLIKTPMETPIESVEAAVDFFANRRTAGIYGVLIYEMYVIF